MSILFVDLVGFTLQSDQADPEDVREVLRMYHSAVKEQIERFGGVVEKFIGDAVMAVFGVPVAHTDDAERAVRAGLRVLDVVEELTRGRPGFDLIARAAVNTGEAVVVLGPDPQSGEALAMGDVVNTSSRLQTAAPPGRLVVGDVTHRATHHAIRYEALAAVAAKGKAEPLELWLAVEPLMAPGERRLLAAPMIGRDEELAVLESLWDRATRERRPQLATAIGPPGAGKSRLARELAASVEHRGGRAIEGRCLPYDNADVYSAFAQQVKLVVGIADEDSPEEARAKLGVLIDAIVPEAERQDVIRSTSLLLRLGLDPPVDEQLYLLYAARRLVECLGLQRPTVFVFEDIHWADTAQFELIEYLAGHVRDAPVLFLALARPELADTRPGWGSGLRAHVTMSLEPLSAEQASTVVGNLAPGSLPGDSVQRIVDVAGGNPLFIEELTAALVEGSNVAERLPTNVWAAIASRVDTLPPDQRAVLLSASVVGGSFWAGAVRALRRSDDVERVLDGLEAKDFIRRNPTSSLPRDVEFTFKHMVIRDVCYSTLPRAERAAAHAAVAAYVEQAVGTNVREFSWLLAHHWEEAGELARAVEYLLLAANRAQEAMAERDALELLDRAQRLATNEAMRTRIKVMHALARTTFEDFDGAYDELRAVLPAVDGADRLEVLLALARSCHWTERTAEALDAATRALETARELDAPDRVAAAMARLSQAHAMRGDDGDLDRALDLGEEALRLWTPGARADDLAEHEHMLADQHYWTGNYDRALELSRASREEAVNPTSAEALLRAGGMAAMLLAVKGDYEEALAQFDVVIALGREMGRPVRVLLNYSTLAFRELYDFDEARRRSEEALTQQGRSASFHMPWMNAEVDLISTDVLAGDIGSAQGRWGRMWDQVTATPAWERWFLGGKLAALNAEIALRAEGAPAAAEWAQRALDMARPVRRLKYAAVAHATLGKALVEMGQVSEGIGELRAAVRGAEQLGNPAGRWTTNAELARALYATGDDTGAERHYRAAADVVRATADRLAPERAQRFLAAAPISDVVAFV